MYDEFVEKAKARALKRVVGDPFKKGIEQGPQVTHIYTLLVLKGFFFFLSFVYFVNLFCVGLLKAIRESDEVHKVRSGKQCYS